MTALQELLTTRLAEPLSVYVERERKAGKSWETIAEDLTVMVGRPVYAESLRRWYR